MKIANVKALMVKGLAVGVMAAAVVVAAPAKAEAQGFRVGVRIGVPVRTGPVYVRPGYGYGYAPVGPVAYGPYRHDDWRWRRDHDFHRGYWR